MTETKINIVLVEQKDPGEMARYDRVQREIKAGQLEFKGHSKGFAIYGPVVRRLHGGG